MLRVVWPALDSCNIYLNYPRGVHRGGQNVQKCSKMVNLRTYRLNYWERLKIDGYMLRCVWRALNPLSIHSILSMYHDCPIRRVPSRGVREWVFDSRSLPFQCSNSHSHSHDYWFSFPFPSHSQIEFPLPPKNLPRLIMRNSNVIMLASISRSQTISQHKASYSSLRTTQHKLWTLQYWIRSLTLVWATQSAISVWRHQQHSEISHFILLCRNSRKFTDCVVKEVRLFSRTLPAY